MTRADPVRAEFQTFERTGAHVGDQDVGGRQQPVEERVIVEVPQVEHDRPFAPIVDLERRHRHRAVEPDRTEHGALGVACRRARP
jgi:hypothetical protein